MKRLGRSARMFVGHGPPALPVRQAGGEAGFSRWRLKARVIT
jgi:hypothetical protein